MEIAQKSDVFFCVDPLIPQPNACSSHLYSSMVAMAVHIVCILVKQSRQMRESIPMPTSLTKKTFKLGTLCEERTHDQTHKFVKLATESVINTRVEKSVKGVKGLSWFLYVPGFNIIREIAIDCTHGTLLGVVKMLVNLWLEKQRKRTKKRYTSITPPSCISRLPRSIVGNFDHLKASELRSFLLFYSLPCLHGLLPDSSFQHYLLLVEAIYILLKHL